MTAAATVGVRDADAGEVDALAALWYAAWLDGHDGLLPAPLVRARSPEQFRARMGESIAEVRVAGEVGRPLGFHLLRGDELYQLFVAAEARGSGVARALVADAEARLAERGVRTAWLACAIGNERAARFYEKCGWRRAGAVDHAVTLPDGVLHLDVWRFEKHIAPAVRAGAPGDGVTRNKACVRDYMEAFRRGDHAAVLACLDDAVEWSLPGGFHARGTAEFDAQIEHPDFTGRPDIVVTRLVEEDDVVVAEGTVRTQRVDGERLHLAFCDVFEMRDGRIARLTSYLVPLPS